MHQLLRTLALLLALGLSLAAPGGLAQAQGDEDETPPSFLFPWDSTLTPVFTGGTHEWTGAVRSGLDFATGSTETAVLAMADGEVTFVGQEACKGGQCNTVKLEHAGGWETWYVHLDAFAPRVERSRRQLPLPVKQGDWIGTEGKSGAGFTHIHIELRRDGSPVAWADVPIEGWIAHDTCTGYEAKNNSLQNKAPCLATDYNGYLSQGDTQVVPMTGGSGYPQYKMASSNTMRGDAYLTELPPIHVARPGEAVTFRFTLQNIGPFDWPAGSSVALTRVEGDLPGLASAIPPPELVLQGRQLTWELAVTAPSAVGVYQSRWQMARAGIPFGDPVTVLLHVVPAGADGLAGELQAFYNNARAELATLYRQNLDRFNAEVERLRQEAERRAQEEARRQVERLLCGAVPATLLLALVPALRARRRRQG